MSTQRLALLALALLALASPAAADCTQGSITLDLLSTSCGSNLHALCLSSFKVLIATSCDVQVEPLLAGGSYVPGIWSSNPTATYTRLMACPTTASAAVTPTNGASASTSDMQAAIKLALERHIYGSSYPLALDSATWGTTGTLALVTTAGGCALKYAVTAVTPSNTAYALEVAAGAIPAVCDTVTTSGQLLNGVECQMDVNDVCPVGKRPVVLPDAGEACALCRAGTFSQFGSSCTACVGGNYTGAVGASTCTTPCPVGTYSSGGLSQCLPCAVGTYQSATGRSTCIPCPFRSYSRLPGGTSCMRCVAGVAKCVAGSGLGYTCDTSNAEAPTAGYQVVSVKTATTLGSACSLTGDISYGNVALFGQCSGISTSGSTYLSIYIDQYCGVTITPIKDSTCAEPGAAYFTGMPIRGHYVTPQLISTRLDTASSYLLTLDPASGSDLDLNYWPATTDVSKAAATTAAITKVCAGTVEVIGGQVDGVPGSAITTCPAGTYNDGTLAGCQSCPVGRVCTSSAGVLVPTQCAADQYQPFLGQTTNACLTCNATASPRYTSYAGADYCTVPYIDTTCGNGQQYDPDTTACTLCPAGTQRRTTRESVCVPCEPGYYSAAGATDCTACPVNQYTSVAGTAARSTGDQKCWSCSTGSVAKDANDAVGQTASITCTVCPPGTVSAFASGQTWHSCVACNDSYFRSGEASPTNNLCRIIPAGYKEKARSGTTYDRAEIEECNLGEVSYWGGGVRTPTTPENCEPCADNNKYAPRKGMSSCQPCSSGGFPDKSNPILPGNDRCSLCVGNTYRPSSSNSATCLICNAGREVGSTKVDCEPCVQGFYMEDVNGNADTTQPAKNAACSPCPVNTYQPNTGQASCIPCAAGTSTSSDGNTACQACALGYYSPNPEVGCLAAPAGTFVNTTGATTFTPCPQGTFNKDEGMDVCEACPPGQYGNTLGARACKTCSAGTFSLGRASACTGCGQGYYAPAGSASCSPCKPGTFARTFNSATCARCSLGSQCPGIASSSAQPCPLGQYADKEGMRLCLPCPANQFQDTVGQQSCKACPAGTTTFGRTGQSSCQQSRGNSTPG